MLSLALTCSSLSPPSPPLLPPFSPPSPQYTGSYELVIVGYGAAGWCGMCFDQINNATFRSWFKDEVTYARTKGVGISGYTLMQHNGWGETIPEAEKVLMRDLTTRGPTACFATDWHATYRQAVLDFIRDTGMSGLETDGQVNTYINYFLNIYKQAINTRHDVRAQTN